MHVEPHTVIPAQQDMKALCLFPLDMTNIIFLCINGKIGLKPNRNITNGEYHTTVISPSSTVLMLVSIVELNQNVINCSRFNLMKSSSHAYQSCRIKLERFLLSSVRYDKYNIISINKKPDHNQLSHRQRRVYHTARFPPVRWY